MCRPGWDTFLLKQTPLARRQRRLSHTWSFFFPLFLCYFVQKSQKFHNYCGALHKAGAGIVAFWFGRLSSTLHTACNMQYALIIVTENIYFKLFWNLQLSAQWYSLIIIGKGMFTVVYQLHSSWPRSCTGCQHCQQFTQQGGKPCPPRQVGRQPGRWPLSWGERLSWKNCLSGLHVK